MPPRGNQKGDNPKGGGKRHSRIRHGPLDEWNGASIVKQLVRTVRAESDGGGEACARSPASSYTVLPLPIAGSSEGRAVTNLGVLMAYVRIRKRMFAFALIGA